MIEILQETKTSVVCVKPVGIAAQGTDPQALPQLLAAQLGCEVYPVHRLDQTVGGVMVYAKTAKEAARLTQSMGEGGMQKTYLAVLTGCPEETSGTLEDLLFHDRVKNKTYVVRRPRGSACRPDAPTRSACSSPHAASHCSATANTAAATIAAPAPSGPSVSPSRLAPAPRPSKPSRPTNTPGPNSLCQRCCKRKGSLV